MFAGDFDAVILDEPTAFLDPLTEADILQEVLEATKGKLLIFVTHRLSFARQADQILYLKNGMIAEHGTHDVYDAATAVFCTGGGKRCGLTG